MSSYYNQVVKGTALQVVVDVLEKYGYNVEFIAVKDTSDKSKFGQGLDNSLLRNPTLINQYLASEGTNEEKTIKDKLAKELNKTIVCLYQPTIMNLAEDTQTVDRSKPTLSQKNIKAIVGYVYAKLSEDTPTEDIANIPTFTDIFPKGVEFFEKLISKADSSDNHLDKWIDEAKENRGLTLMEILKDFIEVSFSVNFNLIVSSEQMLHNIQFLLLKNLYRASGGITSSIDVTYIVDEDTKNTIKQSYTYKVGALTGLETMGSTNNDKLYSIGFSIDDIKGKLFSDYNFYNKADKSQKFPIQLQLHIGNSQ